MLYDYSVKKPIGELNLKRALDKDTGVFSFFFSFSFLHLLHWVIIIHTSPNMVNVVIMQYVCIACWPRVPNGSHAYLNVGNFFSWALKLL